MMKPPALKNKSSFRRYLPLFLMMIPGLLYLLINNYIPMAGLVIAFKDIDYSVGILKSPWCGLKNFEYLFKTSDAMIITRNTICYNAVFIALTTFFAVITAVLLNELKSRFLLKLYQSLILLPYLISMIIVAYLVYAVLSVDTGFFNNSILPFLGLDGIDWYSRPEFWPFILTFVNLWKNVGYLCIIYFASLVGIDQECYEAAMLDGASRLQQIRHITIPLLKPVIITMVLLQIGRIFYADFGLFYQVPMNSGLLYRTTNVIDTYVYRGLLQIGDIGMASAAGMYQSIVGFCLVMLANTLVRKIDPDNALF